MAEKHPPTAVALQLQSVKCISLLVLSLRKSGGMEPKLQAKLTKMRKYKKHKT